MTKTKDVLLIHKVLKELLIKSNYVNYLENILRIL